MVDFSQPWLDVTGTSVWTTAVVGNINTDVTSTSRMNIIGYSELSAHITVAAQQHLILEAHSRLYVSGNITVVAEGQLALASYAHLSVSTGAVITMNAQTDTQIGAGARVEIYGELIARGQTLQPVILRGAEPEACPVEGNGINADKVGGIIH